MKKMNAVKNSIWVALVVVAVMLSNGVAYADTGENAGAYSGRYTATYDIGECRQTAASKTGSTSASSLGSCASDRASDALDNLRERIDNYEPLSGSSGNAHNTTSYTSSSATTDSFNSSAAASSNTHGTHYDGNGYSLELPAYWNDRVVVNEHDASGTRLDVCSKEYPDRVLCWIQVVPSRDRVTGGDIASPNMKQVFLSDGRVVCLRATNYSWIVTSGAESMSKAEAAELVALTTGGKTIADCERAADNGDNLVSADWIANNVKIAA